MVARGRTAVTAGASAPRSTSSESSTSTSTGSSTASTSSSGVSTSGAGGARSERSESSVSVSSPTGSKIVTTTKTTTPTETTKETTAQPQTPITVSADLAKAISDSQQTYPNAWAEATGTTNVQQQFEQVTGTTIPQIIVEAPEETFEDPVIEIPELLPQVFAEKQINLSDDIIQILNDIENGVILVPTWFRNNIEWVKNGHITQQEFRTAYNYLVDTQIVHPAKTGIGSDPTITNNMINQHLDYFTIENGRAKGQITFTLNDNFNPSYYNTDLVNIIQFKTKSGANILPFVKENRLRFTETERQEKIQYDENMEGNIIADLESFVWLGTTTPTAFSTVLRSEIKEGQAATLKTSGFMGAGVAGAIAGLILIGFIADHKRGK